MKKTLIALMLFIGMNAQAQEVYNELRKSNKAVVENPNAHRLARHISQFKLDALDYLAIKMQEDMPDSTVYFLDRQALAMDNYVQLYIKKLVEYNNLPQNMIDEMTKMFMETSKNTPLFKDKDKEMTLNYYASGESLIRFSLDCDWEKAYAIIEKKINKK